MICSKCGYQDDSIPIPKMSFDYAVLGVCKECSHRIDIVPRKSKYFVKDGVEVGEKREATITTIYQRFKYGYETSNEKYTKNTHLDRKIYVNDVLVEIMEIKEPTCSLNAFRETYFNPHKIDVGLNLLSKDNTIPIFIVLKFCDCWASLQIDINTDYSKYKRDYKVPYHRSNELKEKYEVVYIPVKDLTVITGLTLLTNYYFPKELTPEISTPQEYKLSDFF